MIGIPDPGNGWNSLLEKIPEPPGGSFFVVGGWVRDLLLFGPRGVRSDIDVVTPGELNKWAQAITETFKSELRIEPDFLTARTVVESEGLGSVRIDMSQFRKEVYEFPGALPRVSPGSLEEDLVRRDFTVNAIMLEWSVARKSFIRIHDPFDGRKDLKKSEIRLVRPDALSEDPTRLFRLVRLSVRSGLRFPDSLRDAVNEALTGYLWDSVGPSRINREFEKLLKEPDPLGSLNCFSDLGILENLTGLRGLSPARRLRLRRWNFHRESVSRSLAVLEEKRDSLVQEMFFLGFFFGMSRKQYSDVSRRLGLGEKLKARIGRILFDLESWPFKGFYLGFEKEGEGKEGKMKAVADILSFRQIMLLSLLAPEHDLPFWKHYIETDRWLPPLMSGEELLKFPDIPPRARGRVLSELRMKQRTGQLVNHTDALAWIAQKVSEGFP